MSRPRKGSFRLQLAGRFTLAMAVALGAVMTVGHFALETTLDRQIEATILSVAAIQAASVTDDPTGEMHFHEWNLTPEEAAEVHDLNRWAEIWSVDGQSLLRSQFLATDLPLDTTALRLAGGGQLTWTEQSFRGAEIRSLYYPLGRLGEKHEPHVLQVAAPLTARNATLRAAALGLALIAVLVSAATFAGAWWLAGRVVAPVRDITRQAEEIGAATLGRRITAHADTHEYRRLVDVLNTMLVRIDAAFEAQRRFTGDASHELRSPLTALRGELELALRKERSPDEYRRTLASALEEAKRLSALADELLTLARSDAGVMEPRRRYVRLVDPVLRAVDRVRPGADAKQIDITTNVDGDVAGFWDPELLERMAHNLVDNAVKYTTPGGHVRIEIDESEGVAVLDVADTGPGLRPADHARIFERFYRADVARADSEGTGLGLSIVEAIVQAHEGDVAADNRDEGGALFRVRLPLAASGRHGHTELPPIG